MAPITKPTSPAVSAKSIADLTTSLQRTTGDVPPSLIGSSTTVIGDRVYLFGGRLNASAKVYNRVYVLSLTTLVWTRVTPKNQSPIGRYFHSADALHDDRIVFYGGLTVSMTETEGLRSLNDIFILHISDNNSDELRWEYPNVVPAHLPHSRYSHLSSIAQSNFLVVLGGQDVNAGFIDEINVYDIRQKTWREPYPLQTHYSAYQTAAAVVTPLSASVASAVSTPNFLKIFNSSSIDPRDTDEQNIKDLIHQHELHTTIFAYSNRNFYDLERTLHQIDISSGGRVQAITDHTASLTSNKQYTPPELRFLSGAACGQYLMVVGPCINPDWQQFQIWALNITTMTWTRIEAGPKLHLGSWLRGVLWEEHNRFLMFGRPEGSLQDDHTQRLIHFDHLISIDMEASGVYSPPQLTYDPTAQEAGLALLNNPALCDLTILTADGHRARANASILAQRWPAMHSRLEPFLSPKRMSPGDDIPLSGYALTFPDTHDILVAFLQFVYTDHLVTVEQNQPRVLTRLLILADLFGIHRLKALSVHALHQMLQMSTAPLIYQAAALANCPSLQIRALRFIINAKKLLQQQQAQQQQQHQQSTSTPAPNQQRMHAVQSGTPLPQPSAPSAESKLIGIASFLGGAGGAGGASGSSGGSLASHYQPLSKLLKQYDLDAPLPSLKEDITAVLQPSDGGGASPPALQAKNPARGTRRVPSSRKPSSTTASTNSTSSGGSRSSSSGVKKTPVSSKNSSTSSAQKPARGESNWLPMAF